MALADTQQPTESDETAPVFGMASNADTGMNTTTVMGPPLDYSFQDIRELEDLSLYEPISGTPKKAKSDPNKKKTPSVLKQLGVAASGEKAANDGDAAVPPIGSQAVMQARASQVDPSAAAAAATANDNVIITAVSQADEAAAARAKREANRHKMHVRTVTTSVRLSNNLLTSLSGLMKALEPVLEFPRNLMWLDVSCNNLSRLSDELSEFKQLKVIYLHGNNFEHLGTVRKLSVLPLLTKVTFHGNPIEGKKNYKSYIIDALPSLTSLDFTGITHEDRAKADTWHTIFFKGKKPLAE